MVFLSTMAHEPFPRAAVESRMRGQQLAGKSSANSGMIPKPAASVQVWYIIVDMSRLSYSILVIAFYSSLLCVVVY